MSFSVASMPTVLIWIQSGSESIEPIVSSTALPSVSIVSTTSASRAASAGESATVAPLTRSALSRVRFQTTTSWPARARFSAIGAPIVPVPRTAIFTGSGYPAT